jgi:predicted alpha/beta hydrolase family esterase
MKQRYFVVYEAVMDGGREHWQSHLMVCDDTKDLDVNKEARKIIMENWTSTPVDEWDENEKWYDMMDGIAFRLRAVEEATEAEFEVLKKFVD